MNIKDLIKKIYIKIKYIFGYFKYVVNKDIIIQNIDADEELFKIYNPPSSTPLTVNKIDKIEYDLMIIIPAFNSEQWIKECIDSIVTQKTEYTYLTVIIDDGSTDMTGNIIDSYLENENIKIIHQDNKGYSGARNVALKCIKSKYIMFVDSDDLLLPCAIQALLSKAYETNADIVEGNGYSFNEKGIISKIKEDYESYWGGPVLKVMKSKLWEKIEFPEGYLYEDTIIESLVFQIAKKIICIPNEVYAYRIHNNSITQKHDNNVKRLDSYWIMKLLFETQKAMGISIDYSNYRRVMKHIIYTYRRTILLSEEAKKNIFIGTCEFVTLNFNNYMCEKDEYYFLAKAFMKRDYRKYIIYCEELTKWVKK